MTQNVREPTSVGSHVARGAHSLPDLDRVAQLPLGRRWVPREQLHLGTRTVRLREAVGDPELAADRLRALEPVARLVEAAEPRVEIRARQEGVGFDDLQAPLLRPRELLVEK